jgi:tRNA pseudouridine13 synthase
MLADDFCWQFCDDGSLQLDFALGVGSYATALLAEFVQFKEGKINSGNGSE